MRQKLMHGLADTFGGTVAEHQDPRSIGTLDGVSHSTYRALGSEITFEARIVDSVIGAQFVAANVALRGNLGLTIVFTAPAADGGPVRGTIYVLDTDRLQSPLEDFFIEEDAGAFGDIEFALGDGVVKTFERQADRTWALVG